MPICSMCKKSDDDPSEYGEFMKKSDICTHYYCLLLATNLPQQGSDHSGILGFLVRDIRNEIKKCSQRICIYCKESHATISCRTCRKYFHQICGNEKGCSFEFFNEFHSYCHRHVPYKNDRVIPGMPSDCWICKEPLGKFNATLILRAYCCKNGYVHRSCMRKYALSAGYYLRCLWCGKKEFRDDIRRHGVFVPDREARWDNNETIRFADLHSGYSRCDAVTCLCPQGREYFRQRWKLKICRGCGASGVHDKCGSDKIVRGEYTCNFCNDILDKTSAVEEMRKKNKNYAFNYTLYMSKTFEDIDVPFPVPVTLAVAEAEGTQQIVAENSNKPATIVSPTKKVILSERFLFRDNFEIAGTAKVPINESQKKTDISVNSDNMVEFRNDDRLIKRIIFEDILAEGRELSTDMADEVMQRMRDYLLVSGDDVD